MSEDTSFPVFEKYEKEKWYKCDFEGCSASFHRPGRLANHLLAHQGERRFRCEWNGCSKAYTTTSHLRRHIAVSHSFPSPDTGIMCPVEGCNKKLKTRDTLIKHTKRAHSEKSFECKACQKTFLKEEQLQYHSLQQHNNQDCHRCDECKMVFSKIGVYNRHMRRHRLHVCPHSLCYFTSNQYIDLRRHLASVHPKFLKCEHCGKEMKDKAMMRRHVRVHLVGEGLADPIKPTTVPIPCSLCSTVLSTKGSLKRHMWTMHSTEPKIKKPVKRGAERAPRSDKGILRRSTASRLASLEIPTSLNRELINKDEHATDDLASSLILNFVLTGWFGTTSEKKPS